ncbi:MAG: Gfo/Idh/MocA family oxidoreductase [Terriglobia bacterium]
MKTVKIALLGAGDVSPLHAEGIQQSPDTELVGLWNRTPARARERAAQYGCKIYRSAEELVSDPELDAVSVLTNLETHHYYALMAIRAGKHVLVEKPVGNSVAEIEQMKAAADKAGVLCVPVHNYIYEPGIMRTRELLDRDQLGNLVSLHVLYNIHHPETVTIRYPGVIRQILTHHSYISLYLAGEPASVSTLKSTLNDGTVPQENLAMVNMKMKSGALVHLCASFAADDHSGDPWTFLIKVIGTKGATRFSYRDWVENKRAVVHSQTYSAYPYSIRNTVSHFIDRCIRRGEAPLSSIEDAITCQRVIEACEASVVEERHIQL